MAVCMGCDEERTLVGRNESQMDAVVRRMLRDSARRRESDRRVGERAARNSGLGRGEGRYERLEAITVRTAARVLQLQRAGVVTAREARFYLRELVAMDAHAGPGALPGLVRMAQRRRPPGRPLGRTEVRRGTVDARSGRGDHR